MVLPKTSFAEGGFTSIQRVPENIYHVGKGAKPRNKKEMYHIQGKKDDGAKEGDTVSDLALEGKEKATLKDYLKEGPVVFTWYPEGNCYYCEDHMKEMQSVLMDIRAEGATLVAITSDDLKKKMELSELSGGQGVIADLNNKAADKYGLVYAVPDEFTNLLEGHIDFKQKTNLRPASTYVISSDGAVYKKFQHPVDGSANIDAILAALEELRIAASPQEEAAPASEEEATPEEEAGILPTEEGLPAKEMPQQEQPEEAKEAEKPPLINIPGLF
jgi:peroxiredoxin